MYDTLPHFNEELNEFPEVTLLADFNRGAIVEMPGDGVALTDRTVALGALQISSEFSGLYGNEGVKAPQTVDPDEDSCATNCAEK